MYSSMVFYIFVCLVLVSWNLSSKTCCDAIALPSPGTLRTSAFLRPIKIIQGKAGSAIQMNTKVVEDEIDEEVKIIGAMLPGDPMVTGTLSQGVVSLFSFYNTVLLVRIGLSWFPQLYSQFPILRTLQVVTDPYLGVFRSFIPPVGGFDISAIPAFFFLDVMSQTAAAVAADVSIIEKVLEKKKKLLQHIVNV